MPAAIDLDSVTRVLSPKQIRSIVEAQARINVWEGSVRSGKTIGSLLRWLMFVANPPHDGELIMIGKTRETVARNLFAPLQNPNLFGPLTKHIRYTAGAPTATVLGRTVHILGANDEKAEPKVRGMTVAGGYVDEATVLPRSFFDQLLARCSVPGAKVFVTTNPDNPGHWFRKDYLLRANETQLATWHFTIDDNPHLDPGYVAWLKSTYVGLWYRRFILGQWVQAEGAIYDMWDEDRHVVDILPQINRYIALGIDYGTVNPFAAMLLGLGADGRLYFTNEWSYDSRRARRSKTDSEYSADLTQWLNKLEVWPEWTAVDPSAASFVQQLYRDGRVTPTLANNSVLDGIRQIGSLLATDKLKVHRPSCPGWLEEIPGYVWDEEHAEKYGEDKPIKAGDHRLDAGRYAIHTTEAIWQGLLTEEQAA